MAAVIITVSSDLSIRIKVKEVIGLESCPPISLANKNKEGTVFWTVPSYLFWSQGLNKSLPLFFRFTV